MAPAPAAPEPAPPAPAPAAPPAAAVKTPAAQTPDITVRGGLHADFDRIVFDWPRKVAYKVGRAGNEVTVSFDAPASFDLQKLANARLQRSGNYAARSGENASLVFTVPEGAKLKDFTTGTYVVIDVTGTAKLENAGKVAKAAPAPAAQPPAAEPVKSEPAKTEPAPPPPEPAPPSAPTPAPAKAEPAPPALEKPGPGPGAPELLIDTTSGPLTQPPPPAPPPVPEPEPVKEEPAATPPPPRSELGAETAVPDDGTGILQLADSGDAAISVARFDIGVSMAIAVYERGGYAYIILDRKLPDDQANTLAGQPRGKLQRLRLPGVTGYRFRMAAEATLQVRREGTGWDVRLAKTRQVIPITLALVPEPDYALGARLILPVVDAAEPVRMNDPVTGEALIVVPLPRPGEMAAIPRGFADLDVLPTAQGMVIRPVNENVVARHTPDGIEITAKNGLKLSPPSDTGQRGKGQLASGTGAPKLRLFDLNTWRGKPGESFTTARQRLSQTIVDVPDVERDRARLELARLYFANGMALESLGLLKMLEERLPALTSRPEFVALRGAARIVGDDMVGGLADLDHDDLKGEDEIPLWRAYALAKQRLFAPAYPLFKSTLRVLEQYPEPFFSRMTVMAIETALAQDRAREAYDWLDQLGNKRPDARLDDLPAIKYLRGVIEHQFNRDDHARTYWHEVAIGNDRLYRTRAELALIDLDVAEGNMQPLDAAKRLEGMRYSWRGDELELDILSRLGGYYLDGGKYKEGLTTLGHGIQMHPDSPQVRDVHERMVESFRAIFIENAAPDLSPIEALALYEEFRDLIPPGPDGEAVVRNLAERLVSIDLLDQAADLLTAQVRERLKGERKAEVGARLAGIRLLDQKPELALTALEISTAEDVSEKVKSERRYLRARALSELGRDQDALLLLANDGSEQARMLHADIAWRAKHWSEAAEVLDSLVGPPPDPGTQLKPDRIQFIINRATALALAADQQALNRLAIDFGPAMAGTPQNEVFRLLTRTKADNIQDLAVLQSKMGEVDMFRNFLNQYRAGDEMPAEGAPAEATEAAP